MAKDKSGFNPSWFLVIIMLGSFWPVGLYFLWCKMQHTHSDANFKKRERGMSKGALAMALVGLFLLLTGGGGFGAFLLLGGGALMAYDIYLKKRGERFSRYMAVIGVHPTMSIMSIASAMGVDYNTACADLQAMINEQHFHKSAYLDLGRGLIVTHSRFADAGEPQSRPAAPVQPAAQPAKKAQEASPHAAPAPAQPRPQSEPQSEYVRKLVEIRAVNEAIRDEKVSRQIERIEQITANIFEIVVQHPEKRSQINTFMNYYLPTTLKLLTTYATLEKQGVSGENIDASKKNIESLLDQLVWAFEQQNDQMFAREALDIHSDIKVMETMMARDGLSEGTLPKSPFAAAAQRRK